MRDVLALKPGSHLCLLYDTDPEEQVGALLAYLKNGLDAGERCVYVADAVTLRSIRDSLEGIGVELSRVEASGALLLQARADRSLGPTPDEIRGLVDQALADGFTALRFGIEMTWALGADTEIEALKTWEATLDAVCSPELPLRIVCQYGRGHMDPPAVLAALHTHPLAVLGNDVCPNPYYAPPVPLDALPVNVPSSAPLDWMLAQLQWTRAFEREREKRIEAQVSRAAAEAVEERIRDLFRAAETSAIELRKANAIKDEFVGLISHELRTPITVILGNATVLLKSMNFENDAHYGALQDIRSEAERLNRLVANMLVLAKLDGSHQPDLEPMLIGPVVARVAAEHQRRYARRKLNISLQDIGTPCLANAVYVEQVLSNLLSNAEKYSAVEQEVELTLSREDDWLTLNVSDRGIGIDDGDLEHVFEAFFRTDAASSLSAGIGIGLAACKRLVEGQNGKIWARPRDGGGAEFGFSLKVVEAPE